jgi:hypothetical protein
LKPGAKISPATVSSEEETVGGEEADRWVLHGSEGERGSWVPVREEVGWAADFFLCWAETVPLGPFYYFFDFFSPFLFSDFRFVSKSFVNCFNSNQTNS